MKHIILIVDDDRDELELFEDALSHFQQNEFECAYASDGEQAMKMLNSISPDYIFLDFNMPRMNGIEFLFRLRARNNLGHTKIYMHSMKMTDDMHRFAILAGASGTIKKVNSIKELVDELGPVLLPDPSHLSAPDRGRW